RVLLKTDGKPLKESSIGQYRSHANNLVQAIQPINDMRDMEAICDKLLKVEDVGKMETHLNCLKMIFRNLTKEEIESLMTTDRKSEVDKLLNDLTETIMAQKDLKDEENDQIPSEEEQKHYIPWNELNDKVRAYRDRLLLNVDDCTTEELEHGCIAALYVVDHEPRRNEYGSLTYDENGENVYVDGNIILRDYKTFAAYGEYEFALSEETKVLMDELVRRKKQLEIKWIFGGNDQNPRVNWHIRMRKAFNAVSGKPLISRYLRKYRISFLQREGSLTYTKERDQLAEKMGHSTGEQQKVYTLRFEHSPSIEEDAERSEAVSSSAPTGSKRKRKAKEPWVDQEVAELRGLLSEKGKNPRAILDEAVARNLMM
ncbi:hypothetical protein HK104_007931, partial [Borealophlyctis nickersoniae]